MKTSAGTGPRADVAAFESLTRALVGVTIESLDALGGAVSLPQFRMLLVLDGLGRVPCSQVAAALGLGASSVTRLADKLEAAGLLARGADERSRSIVTVGVTPTGRQLVARVVERRHELFAAVLDRMPAEEREASAAVARRFAALAAHASEVGTTGPLPL